MQAQCGHTFQFLKRGQKSKFLCETLPFLTLTTDVHHAWGLDPVWAPSGVTEESFQVKMAIKLQCPLKMMGPENDGTENMKSQLEQVV